MVFEYLQGERLHTLSRQPGSVSGHPRRKMRAFFCLLIFKQNSLHFLLCSLLLNLSPVTAEYSQKKNQNKTHSQGISVLVKKKVSMVFSFSHNSVTKTISICFVSASPSYSSGSSAWPVSFFELPLQVQCRSQSEAMEVWSTQREWRRSVFPFRVSCLYCQFH